MATKQPTTHTRHTSKRARVYTDIDTVGGMSFAEFKDICHTIGIETVKEILRLVKAGGYSAEQIAQRAIAKSDKKGKRQRPL